MRTGTLETNARRIVREAAATRRCAAGLVLLLVASCRTYVQPDVGVTPNRGADLRLHFTTPRPLTVLASDGDTVVLKPVRVLDGRVVAVHGDTLELQVARWNGGSYARDTRRPTLMFVPAVREPGLVARALRGAQCHQWRTISSWP